MIARTGMPGRASARQMAGCLPRFPACQGERIGCPFVYNDLAVAGVDPESLNAEAKLLRPKGPP